MTVHPHDAESARFSETLLRISNDLGFGHSRLEKALPSITEMAAAALQVERCGVWRTDKDRDRMVCLDLYDREAERHEIDIDFWVDDHRAYIESLKQSRVVDADDALADRRTADFDDTYLVPRGVQSMLDAPIRMSGEVVGVICNEQTSRKRHWTEQEKSFAASLGDLLATAFEAADHEKLQRHFLQAQKLDAVGRLAGGVAHDFNNLLTAIRGNLDLVGEALQHHPAARADVSEELEHMSEAIERAAALTRQLLTFSGRQIQASRVFDANQVIAAMESMLVRLLPENINMHFDLGAEPIRLRADPTLVEQIVLNLILNARDAMPEGGCLGLRSHAITRDGEALWQLSIADSGVGMSQDIHGLVFEPFFTTKEEGKGSGLGLSTVAGIVKSMGGQVRLESLPGQGTTLTVEAPAFQPEQSGASS